MAATRNVRAGDWIAIAIEQPKACALRNGVQLMPDGVVGVKSMPFTPGEFAKQTFAFWASALVPVVLAAGQEGKDVTGLVGDADGVRDWPGILAAMLDRTESIAVRQTARRLDTALRTMLDATAKGASPGTRNHAGLLCLDGTQVPRFWEAVKTLGREYSFLAASTSIPVHEYWTAVKEGAEDGLRNVGEAAGAALAAAGEAVGTAASGVLSGLGVVNTALLVGGAVVVGKMVF